MKKFQLGYAIARVLFPALLALLAGQAFGLENEYARPTTPGSALRFQGHLDRHGIGFEVPPAGKAILVNVPAFELIAFSDGQPTFRSKVIVGAPWHPTPLLETYTTAVRFRPTWRPTPSMIASGEYRDRVWPPGRNNPLGLAAVRLEPGLLVYLHDTNHRELFDRDNRALSHGCVRVERWDELVAWLLDLGLDEVHRLANGTRTINRATPPIPVTLGYFTTFPDDTGRIVKYDDIYRRDAGLTPPLSKEAGSTITCGSARAIPAPVAR